MGFGKAGFEGAELGLRPFAERAQRILDDGARQPRKAGAAGMLRVFADRCAGGARAMLVQANGGALPFPDASFDAVLLIAVFGDLSDWRPLVGEARRVLRSPRGAIIIGRTGAPDHGIDERMRQCLDTLLEERMPGLGMRRRRSVAGREEAVRYLAAAASATTELTVADLRLGAESCL